MNMSGNGESTSNSIKFAPMPMSALMANFLPLKEDKPDSRDSSFSSADDSDDNHDHDKENSSDNWASNLTYPSKEKIIQSVHKNLNSNVYLNSEHKKRNVLMPHNPNNVKPQNSCVKKTPEIARVPNSSQKVYLNSEHKKRNVLMPHNPNNVKPQNSCVKKTPEIARVPNSGQKVKSATPKIKSGIRRFTPNSSVLSHKKTPQKAVIQNRDRVRCELFTQKQQQDEPKPPPPREPLPKMPAPETPMNNKKPMPASYAATPSYPQGIVNNQNSKILFKTISIKDKKYIFIKKLGVGGSSEVYKVLEVGTSCEYAVKCVYLATDQDLAQGYINEVRLLRELQNSDRVIRLVDYEYDRTNHFLRMVLEVGETDLSSFLKARGAGLPPALVLHYWEEMLHAVHYIHEHGVIHADLKPANFLLVCGRLKLIDFGIASAISSDATSVVRSQATGTYSYISPEALMGGAGGYGGGQGDGSTPIKISFRSDVWSLGCILYSMVYGRTPFGHIPNLAKLAAILDPNHRIDYPPVEHLPPSLLAALKWCLTYNARARPYVRELLAIPYLQPARAPLPPALLDKLQPLVSLEEFRLLQSAQL